MRLLFVSVSLGIAATVSGRHLPRQSENTVHLDSLVPRNFDCPTLQQDGNGRIPYFAYEEKHLNAHGDSELPKPFGFIQPGNKSTSANGTALKGPHKCKVYPDDPNWPSLRDWAAFDKLTGRALLKPTPEAHVCYDNATTDNGTNNAAQSAACLDLTDKWTNPFTHVDDPIEMLTPLYQGMTCQPPARFDQSGTCDQGGYPLYVVNVTNVEQIQLAVNFARNTGIRLVIKNTGHDFSGKSGGAGSLSVWTHGLKEIAFLPSYQDSEYTGPAIKAGVGIQGYELYAAANKFGVIAMGGECPTVGAMGGWIQGGGHSPVSSLWGMGADHVLGFEVVLADGQFVTANKEKNSDLFWALRGGGGGTFGIVTSVIVRVFEDLPVTAGSWNFTTGPNVTDEQFASGMKAWFETFPSGADSSIYAYFQIFNFGGVKSFTMAPYFAAGKSMNETKRLIEPWFAKMESLGIPVHPQWHTYDGFYDAYNASFPVEDVEALGIASGSRMFPRANFENETLFEETYDLLWKSLDKDGLSLIGYNIAPTYERGGRPNNAVNPAWRNVIGYFITGAVLNMTAPAEYQMEQRRNFTFGPMQEWRDMTPGSGTYLNEGDRLEPNWQWSFYGSFYPRLLEIKQRYDPYNVFYAGTAVGSEFFEVCTESGALNENGRLCVNENPSLYRAEGPDYDPERM